MISAENTNYNLRFSDIADEEIEQAIEYHSLKSENGEYNFKSQLNEVLDALEINPFFQVRYKNIRLYLLNLYHIWCSLKCTKMKK